MGGPVPFPLYRFPTGRGAPVHPYTRPSKLWSRSDRAHEPFFCELFQKVRWGKEKCLPEPASIPVNDLEMLNTLLHQVRYGTGEVRSSLCLSPSSEDGIKDPTFWDRKKRFRIENSRRKRLRSGPHSLVEILGEERSLEEEGN
ncbi:hypothetical protein AKJ57_00935 [candidate division MSBL1 archaeon SCGC-AAA259A05]|uniref:Uncharacterized protein n=1 Tax=candidate division MSBL1 archaeon SCGC-AAA259A05 TaxID=1698259 RepID=A0A133UBC6_9EURY|nr:hypothetical protein AKJ57_00935 [candidate division MSBL1 archaeon SCGC-AAA259A05]